MSLTTYKAEFTSSKTAKRIVVHSTDGTAAYVRSGTLLRYTLPTGLPHNNRVEGLTLTKSARWAAKFEPADRDDFTYGIHTAADCGFYPQLKIFYCG